MRLFLRCAAFVNGLREGWTAERPFENEQSIMEELRGKGAVKERLSVEAELALAQRELERVTAEASATGLGEAAVASTVQKHMMDLGMGRYRPPLPSLSFWRLCVAFADALSPLSFGYLHSEAVPPVVMLSPAAAF